MSPDHFGLDPHPQPAPGKTSRGGKWTVSGSDIIRLCNITFFFYFRHLYDWHFISLCLFHVGDIVLQLKARKVVIDILKNQIDSHERHGGHSFSFHNKTESGSVFEVKSLGALHPDFTCKTDDRRQER